MNPQRVLIILGTAMLVIGLAWPLLSKFGIGRLPGDILIRKGGLVFYAPLMTSLIVSAVITVVFWLLRR